jgi:hypothetical protein
MLLGTRIQIVPAPTSLCETPSIGSAGYTKIYAVKNRQSIATLDIAGGRVSDRDDRQIISDFPKSCQAPESKINRFRRNPNHRYHSGHPPRQEGRIAIVTDAGLDAVDAAASGAILVARRVLP